MTSPHLLRAWTTRRLPLEQLGLRFQITVVDPPFISRYDLLEEVCFIDSGWNQVIATAAPCSYCSGSRSCRTNFTRTHFIPRSWVRISGTVVSGTPRLASSSPTVSCWSLLIEAFSSLLLGAGLPECGSLSTDSQPSLKASCHTFICTVFITSSPKAFWIIQIVSTEEYSRIMQNLMQIHSYTSSVILNAMAIQYTCSLNGVYHPHWLVQWNHHCSWIHIPVHSPWLPGYINITQTIVVILTVAGLFPDRPHIFKSTLLIQ